MARWAWSTLSGLFVLAVLRSLIAQLNYIRTIAEFISQPQYSRVVAMFSPINEPNILLRTFAVARPL